MRAKTEQRVSLASLAGFTLPEAEEQEAGARLRALLHELASLLELDLEEIEPVQVFRDDGRDA